MEAIKTLFGLIVKLILVSIGIFLLFCLAGYVMAEHNEDAGLMVLLGGLALIPLWFMRGLVGRFVKASAIAIIGLVGISAAVYGVLKVFPNILDVATEDNMAMVLGFFVMLVVVLVTGKVLQGIGSMFSGISFGSSSSRSYSAPSIARSPQSVAPKTVTAAAPTAKKSKWNYALTLANPGEWRGAGRFCPSGSVQASNYSEAMNLVQEKHASVLNLRSSMRGRMVVYAISQQPVQAQCFRENR